MNDNEIAYIQSFGSSYFSRPCIISVYHKSTKQKITEYGMFTGPMAARQFAREHNIQLEEMV